MALAKVLVPEKLSPEGLLHLRKSLHVDEKRGISADEIKEVIPQYEALIVRSETQVTEELLRAGTQLKVVARAGVGTDNIGACRFLKTPGLVRTVINVLFLDRCTSRH